MVYFSSATVVYFCSALDIAHLYLLFLAFLGIMAWSETVLFSLPAAVHISYCRTVIGAATRATRTRLLDYRRLYRLVFAAGSVVFVFGRILSLG